VAGFLMSEFNKHGFSDTFWAYGKFLDEASFLGVLNKAYPVSTSGKLKSYTFDYESGVFNCQWNENPDISAPTIIYIPNIENINKDQITDSPEVESIEIVKIENSHAGHLIIPSSGKSMEMELNFKINKTIE
jgi:hypothetical protein